MPEVISIAPFDIVQNENDLLSLQAFHFTGPDADTRRQSYVQWLRSNPVDGSIFLAAYVDGTPASFLGFMAREVVGFGRTFRCALAFAAATHPQFGGRALYRRLANAGWDEARRRGFDFAVGYTVRKYVLDMEMRMGWANMGAGPVMVLPLDAAGIVRSALPRVKAWAPIASPANPVLRWRAQRLARRGGIAGVEIQQVAGFSGDLNMLTEALRAREQITFAKDRRALQWLYLSPYNPFKYDIVEARQDGKLAGIGVGRRMDLSGLDGYGIVDLVAWPGYERVLSGVASRLLQIALPQRPQAVAALVSWNGAAFQALRSLGFIDSRQAFTLIYRPTGDGLPAMVGRPENWCHSWGNNDTV